MDQPVFLIPHEYWHNNHPAPAQIWAYGATNRGMTGLRGFNQGLYYQHSYPPAGFQSPQAAPVPFYPTDYYATSTHSDIFRYSMPGSQAGFVPRTHLHHQCQLQQGGMFNAPKQFPEHNLPRFQSQKLDTARQTTENFSNQLLISRTRPKFYASATTKDPPPQLSRGPPRKPKRSGPAIWVGNIPMDAPIEALKDHFSKDAREEIESFFLMSKSNCGFVNYTTKEACYAAVDRFNHSLFGSVRLLCRIRKDPSEAREGSQLPGSGRRSPMSIEFIHSSSASSSERPDEASEQFTSLSSSRHTASISPPISALPTQHPFQMETRSSDRYFVLKCLTMEDLQNCLIRGTWETQSHNQKILHDAFCAAINVYLVFSINKSGEYFGYARMTSSPFDSPSQQSTITPLRDTSSNDSSQTIETPATATAPRGYIVDDSTRGILFWQAERDYSDSILSSEGSRPFFDTAHHESKPFQVEWLSIRRVAFRRTKGMRNSWNANKEVKVARDGTELETDLGKRLVALFHEGFEAHERR